MSLRKFFIRNQFGEWELSKRTSPDWIFNFIYNSDCAKWTYSNIIYFDLLSIIDSLENGNEPKFSRKDDNEVYQIASDLSKYKKKDFDELLNLVESKNPAAKATESLHLLNEEIFNLIKESFCKK